MQRGNAVNASTRLSTSRTKAMRLIAEIATQNCAGVCWRNKMITESQKLYILELQKNIRKVDAQFDGIFGKHRQKRRRVRREYLEYLDSIGATKADLFEIKNGKKPCCGKYHPTKIRDNAQWTSSDGTREKSGGVSWCSNCGSLIQGDKVFKPWTVK